jgi:hypothetical protein
MAARPGCQGLRIRPLARQPVVEGHPAEGPRDFVISLQGVPFGTLHYKLTYAGDLLKITAESRFTYASGGVVGDATRATTTRWAWPGGELLDSQLASGDGLKVDVSVQPDGRAVTAAWEGLGLSGETTLECGVTRLLLEPNVLGGEALEMLAWLIDWQERQVQLVDSLDPSMLFSDLTVPAVAFPARVSVVGQTRLRVAGKTTEAAVVDLVMPFVRYRAYYALDGGRLVRYELPQVNVVVDLVSTPPLKLTAVDAAVFGRLSSGSAKWPTVGSRIEDPLGLERAELDVRLALAGPASADPLSLLNSGRQAFTGQVAYDRGVWHVTGHLLTRSAYNGPWDSGGSADGSPALGSGVGSELGLTSPGPRIESAHAAILARAQEVAAPGPQTYWGAVQQVIRWVAANVKPEVTFGSALSALQTLRGDCAPKAYLSVAMLRSLGVPSRPIYGLMLIQGEIATHVWVEAYLGPEIGWVEVDPTNPPQVGMLSGAHLRVSHESAVVAPALVAPEVTVIRVEY